jgi:hypothetical protein
MSVTLKRQLTDASTLRVPVDQVEVLLRNP